MFGAARIATYHMGGGGAGTAGETYWYTTLGTASGADDYFYGIEVDTSGNVYAFGNEDNGTNRQALFAKYDSNGNLQLQRNLGDSNEQIFQKAAIDTSNNLYVSGHTENFVTGSGLDFFIMKLDTSGNITWQKVIYNSTNTELGLDIAVNSSGEVYYTGYSTFSGNNDVYIGKLNADGTSAWARTIGNTNSDQGYAITLDSGGNAYATGFANSGSGARATIFKYNSTGTLQWQVEVVNTGRFQGIAVDSSDNLYTVGYIPSATTGSIMKWNSSGVLQWQRQIAPGTSCVLWDVRVDGSDVYLTGLGRASGSLNKFLIFKYDTNGNQTWQRSLGHSTLSLSAYCLSVRNNNIYVGGGEAGNFKASILKVPTDGTKTQTFGSYTYGSESFTSSTPTNTTGTPTYTSTNRTMTVGNGAYTFGTLTYTAVKTNL
jgi:hypothetical protein